jgi:hypothetical protein
LARAAIPISVAGNHDAGAAMLSEAAHIAERYSDKGLQGLVDYAAGIHHWSWIEISEARRLLASSAEALGTSGMAWDAVNAAGFLCWSLFPLGRFDDVLEVVDQYRPRAQRIGNRLSLINLNTAEAGVRLYRTGDLDAWEQSARTGLEMAIGAWSALSHAHLAYTQFWRGHWEEAAAAFDHRTDMPGVLGGGIYGRMLVKAYLGDRQAVHDEIASRRDDFAQIGRPNGWRNWTLTCVAAESLYVLREYDEAAELRPVMEQALASGFLCRVGDWRLTRSLAGATAAASSSWDAAEAHFVAALEQAEDLPSVIDQADTRRLFAQMLIDRASSGDGDRARLLIGQALEIYDRIGMPGHAALVTTLLDRA